MSFLGVILLFVISVSLSLVSNFMVLNFAKNLGIRNTNNVIIRWSNESKPSLGGVSMYVGFLLIALIVAIIYPSYIDGKQLEFLGLIVAASSAFFMGIADDAYDTKPWMKLAIQIFCGLILCLTNNLFILFPSDFLNVCFTILWVVILMNSLNMLDNMDGISATICGTILMGLIVLTFLSDNLSFGIWSILILATIGTLIGFLYFNIHPSKMFMGDGGSQFLGLVIAFFTGKLLFSADTLQGMINWKALLLVLVLMTPAAVDTLTVIVNRIKAGKSPMVGGKDHTTHFLVYAGLNDKKVWWVFLTFGMSSVAVSGLFFWLYSNHTFVACSIGIAWFLGVFFLLYKNTVKYSIPSK